MTDLKTILLVDDQAITMFARSQFISENGYRVVTASSGEEAVEISLSGTHVDLILMDIDLGEGMDGTEAAEIILARKDVPILFLSSYTDKEIVDKTGRISSYGYVVKDSGDTVLLASISMAFRLYEARMDIIRQRNELNSSRAELEALNRKFEAANLELHESLLYTQAIMKNAPFGCILYRVDESGRLILTGHNPAAESISTKNLKELVGSEIKDAFPDLEGSKIPSIYKMVALEGGVYQQESLIYNNGSRNFVFDICAFGISPGNMAVFFTDESEKNHMKSSLRRSRERYMEYVKNAPYGVFITDDSGRFLELNPAASAIAGFTEQELIGKNLKELVPPGTESAGLDVFLDTVRRDRTSGEFPVLRGDGAVRYWSVETVALSDNRCLGFVMDITKRRKDEATRKRQHRFIESLIETIPNPVFYKDSELKYMGCNRAFEELTGKKRDEITGKTVFQLFEYELARKYDETDRELLALTGNQYYEGKMKTGYGEYRDVMFSKSTFVGPENQAEGIVGVITDITDMKKAEAARTAAIEENRTLYVELQHRVKNTMNIITGIINIECDSLKGSPAVKSLESIRNRVFTLSELYSLLYVSGNAKVVQLDRYLENITRSLDLTLVRNSGMRISTKCASIEADVRVATSMGLILNELVTNACKYAKAGSADGRIEVRLSSDEMNIIIEVEDNGTGLPDNFDIKKAAGLGLQLVNGLAMQHKGRIDVLVENTTLFRITVPEKRR
ncbi:MAG TPA: PAS domain S-box protein [Spirochaetota bacterium]|nr:PAS domain S-box protein [Spirochaetota bacterium]